MLKIKLKIPESNFNQKFPNYTHILLSTKINIYLMKNSVKNFLMTKVKTESFHNTYWTVQVVGIKFLVLFIITLMIVNTTYYVGVWSSTNHENYTALRMFVPLFISLTCGTICEHCCVVSVDDAVD